MKFLVSFIICLLFSFGKTREDKCNDIIYGKWKVSEAFCSETDEVPKGFILTFLKNKKGYLTYKDVGEKEFFVWKTNSDTLKLNFERESEMKNVIFKKDHFVFRELPFSKKYLELRYVDFINCGVKLEFIE